MLRSRYTQQHPLDVTHKNKKSTNIITHFVSFLCYISTQDPDNEHEHCRNETDIQCSGTVRQQRNWRFRCRLRLLYLRNAHIASKCISIRTIAVSVIVCLEQHPPSNLTRFGGERHQQLDVDIDGRPRSIFSESMQCQQSERNRVHQCSSRNTPNVRNENVASFPGAS